MHAPKCAQPWKQSGGIRVPMQSQIYNVGITKTWWAKCNGQVFTLQARPSEKMRGQRSWPVSEGVAWVQGALRWDRQWASGKLEG